MKKVTHVLNVFGALLTILAFTQCTGKTENTASETAAVSREGDASSNTGLKIAYINLDTLLLNYHFWNDVTESMLKKEENARATLNRNMKDLEKESQEFKRKIENNAFVSQDRAQQEYNRISRKEQDLESLQSRLSTELANESAKNELILRDSIKSYIREYNKVKGYNMILTNTGGLNSVLYADPLFNITQEIIDGMNTRYNFSGKK